MVLGTQDIEKGLDCVESLTGIRPFVDEASTDAGHSFVSARLSLSGGFNGRYDGRQFLEVIGPNLDFGGGTEGAGAYTAAMAGQETPRDDVILT